MKRPFIEALYLQAKTLTESLADDFGRERIIKNIMEGRYYSNTIFIAFGNTNAKLEFMCELNKEAAKHGIKLPAIDAYVGSNVVERKANTTCFYDPSYQMECTVEWLRTQAGRWNSF